jgi:hypothetical protein
MLGWLRLAAVLCAAAAGRRPAVHAVMGHGGQSEASSARHLPRDKIWQPTPQTPTTMKPPSDPHDGVVPTPF